MATFQKYPVYTYDEPATYEDFRGGINLDSSSENLADNEMRDCVNMEYSHITLQKRKGAKRICRLICKKTLNFIQGITIFTKNNSFIVVAADGRLYAALYIEGVDLELEEVPIFDFDLNKLKEEDKQKYGVYSSAVSPRALSQFVDLPVYDYIREGDLLNNGYVYNPGKNEDLRLIFQTKSKIEFASYNNRLYAATGTRLIVIDVNEDEEEYGKNLLLSATCAAPYIPNGIEYQIYGENFMSPYPYECIGSAQGAAAAIKNIILYPDKDRENILDSTIGIIKGNNNALKCSATMIFPSGKGPTDYFYKWEIYDYDNNPEETNKTNRWRTLIPFKKTINISKDSDEKIKPNTNINFSEITIIRQATEDESFYNDQNNYRDSDTLFYVHTYPSKLENKTVYDGTSLGNVKLRCTFTDSLTNKKDGNGNIIPNEYVPTKLDGSSFGSFQVKINIEALTKTETTWRTIQSCKKILADGNKFILYDDAYNSGSWFKTVIGKPGYITNRGSLNFKTTKNEQLVKVVHFKGVLIAFSHSKLIGGNISVITGNGDDDPADQSYSPYIRKVVNSEITCDNPSTVQIAENLLFFKFRDTVYAIEGSNISSEIITLFSMNDKLKQRGALVDIPWEEPCVSEITEEYYGLIWKEKIAYENGEAYVSRPAMRLKMYYKIGQDIDGKVFFPWLRDESPMFNTDLVLNIDGISTHLRDMELLQYKENIFLDNGNEYESTIKLKAYDLNYPKISKFIRNVLLYYGRAESKEINIDLFVENEAGHLLVDPSCAKESLQDEESVGDFNNTGRLGKTYTDTKVYNSKYMFPLLQATATIKIKSKDLFSFSSITFNYYTTDMPDKNPYDSYVGIARQSTAIKREKIKKDTPLTRVPEKLNTDSYQDFFDGTNKTEQRLIILYAGNPLDRFKKEKADE